MASTPLAPGPPAPPRPDADPSTPGTSWFTLILAICTLLVILSTHTPKRTRDLKRASSILPANVQRQLEGRQWSSFALICTVCLFLQMYVLSDPGESTESHFVLYSTHFAFAQVCLPFIAWWRLGRSSVPIGLLLDFFWFGGVFSAMLAGEVNTATIQFWPTLFPHCSILGQTIETPGCKALLLAEWIMTAGWWEEILKASFLLFRLKVHAKWAKGAVDRYATDDVPRTTCLCIPTDWCTCWWRIARSPEAVFLCGLSVGAGFGAIENIQYMIMPQAEHADIFGLMMSFVRMLLPVHVFFTGFVGLQLAKRYFGPEDARPTLFACLAPSIIAHGAWDWLAVEGILPAEYSFAVFFGSSAFGIAWLSRLLWRGSLNIGATEGSAAQQTTEPAEVGDIVKDNREVLSAFVSMVVLLLLQTLGYNSFINFCLYHVIVGMITRHSKDVAPDAPAAAEAETAAKVGAATSTGAPQMVGGQGDGGRGSGGKGQQAARY